MSLFGDSTLDESLSAVRSGSFLFVEGAPGTGKTTLGIQFVDEGCKQGEKSLYVITGQSKESLLKEAESLGRDLRPHVESGLLVIRSLSIPMDSDEAQISLFALADEIEELRPKRIVLDCMASMLLELDHGKVSAAFGQRMLSFARESGAIVLGLANSDALGLRPGLGAQLRFLADVVVELSLQESEMGGLVRVLKITKSREAPTPAPVLHFSISRGARGVRIIAIPPSLDVEEPLELVPTGVQGLDELLGGGLPRASLNVIEGPVGSGKTVLGLALAIKAAKAGRRALVVTLESSKGVALRIARSLGYVPGDPLDIVAIVPQALGPLEQFETLESLTEELKPDLIFVDSLTAIEHAVGSRGMLDFTRYLQWMAKDRGITVVCSQLGSGRFERNARTASLYADTVILLTIREKDGVLVREAAVLKSRVLGLVGKRHRIELKDNELRFAPA
ncbi:MAG TPA: hypothetical protein ENG69_05035 [Candidatus Korarchaeota archaeon]|nr:hypothetical protein [Candidatus Korarchaeota archaeon]